MTNDLRADPRYAGVTLLTAAEVAELLGVNKRHVWRLAATGDLPKPVRLGERVVRWRLADLEAHLSPRSPQPPEHNGTKKPARRTAAAAGEDRGSSNDRSNATDATAGPRR